MADVVPDGEISLRIDRVCTMLANCAAFQVLCGVNLEAVPATAALDFIYPFGVNPDEIRDEETGEMIPNAVVSFGATSDGKGIATGGADTFNVKGDVIISLAATIPAEYRTSFRNAGYWFCNYFGLILKQLRAQCGTGNTEHVRNVRMDTRPMRAKEVEEKTFWGDVMYASIEVLTGLEKD